MVRLASFNPVRSVNTITIRANGTALVRSENKVMGSTSEQELIRQ